MNRRTTPNGSKPNNRVGHRAIRLVLLSGLATLLSGCVKYIMAEPDVMIVLPSSPGMLHTPPPPLLMTQGFWTINRWEHTNCRSGIPGVPCYDVENSDPGDETGIAQNPSDEMPELALDELSLNARLRLMKELRFAMHEIEQSRATGAARESQLRFVGTPYRPVETNTIGLKIRGSDNEFRTIPVTFTSTDHVDAARALGILGEANARRRGSSGRSTRGSFTTGSSGSSTQRVAQARHVASRPTATARSSNRSTAVQER